MDLIVEVFSALKWNPLNYTFEETVGLLTCFPVAMGLAVLVGARIGDYFRQDRIHPRIAGGGVVVKRQVATKGKVLAVGAGALIGGAAHTLIMYLL